MQLVDEVVSMKDEVATWRRTLHADPELLFDVHNTAAFVADKLRSFGCDEVVTGIGQTGVVGIIHGRPGGNGPAIGLRADMDALPINEITGLPWASRTPGKMHACGHDGHTAMLLGAARHLAATRNFTGSVAVIFQPAEEGGGGGREMVNDGMMERFGITKVFGMHNLPGLPVGQFAIRKGPIMAATDIFDVTIKGRGGHAAMPYQTIDPIVASSRRLSLRCNRSPRATPIRWNRWWFRSPNSLAARPTISFPKPWNWPALCAPFQPKCATWPKPGSTKSLRGVASAHGVRGLGELSSATIRSPSTIPTRPTSPPISPRALPVRMVERKQPPTMGGEDFSFMLEARPGAFIFMGNGDTAACITRPTTSTMTQFRWVCPTG
jgi:metal-dependent amidase/aminoacylase/carboxypeptidase family protein